MFKKIFFSMAALAMLTACNGDYTDWADPQHNDEPATVSFGNGSVTEVGLIDLNELNGQPSVAVCQIVAPTSSAEGFVPEYKITLGDKTFDIDANGQMAFADLNNYVHDTYGYNPVEHDVTAVLTMWLNNGSAAVKTVSAPFTVKVIGVAPVIEEAYYLVGTMNGWNNTNTDYCLVNGGGDVYEDPVFSITVPAPADGSGLQFKVFPKSSLGNWDGCLANSEEEGKFNRNNAGGDFVVDAVEGAKFYVITFNMLEGTWWVKALSFDEKIYFVGTANGWNNGDKLDQQSLILTNSDKGQYAGYLYGKQESYGNTFRLFTAAQLGNWGDCTGASAFETMTGAIAAGSSDNNLEFTEGDGVYYVELSLIDKTVKATKVEYMGVTGDFCGWNEGVQMTWNADDYCFEADANVTAAGWKFRVNGLTDPNWSLNLGGSTDNLVQNGDNLSVAGSKVRLYPCHVKADKVYCTVE